MIASRIKRLPRFSWGQSIKPPRYDYGRSDRSVFGFDTEYDSQTGELLSVQLFRPGVSIFCPVKSDFEFTYENLRNLIPGWKSPFLVAFFALADISKLSNYWEAKLSETGIGCLMAESGDMTIFDISTFWSSDRTFSLKKLGKLIGMEKLEYDTTNVSRRSLTDPAFYPYAMRDAEICYFAYDKFLRETVWRLFNLDILHYRSAPTISAQILRRRLSAPVVAPRRYIRQMALRAYWGGRSEIFFKGKYEGTVTESDANSEYPRSAIALGGLPDGDDWKTDGDWREYKDGFVKILFAYPDDFVGFYGLPVESDGSLYWPKSGESYCTISELRAALSVCPELSFSVRRAVGYTSGTRTELADYLAELLTKKDAATGADRYVYKLLANSVIGKLAQNKRATADAAHILYAGYLGVPADFAPRQFRTRVQTGSCYWPEAASLILGKARSVLYLAMSQIGEKNLLLCSTDSVLYKGNPVEIEIAGVPFETAHTGDGLTVWREKVYIMTKSGKVEKAAHHALPGLSVIDRSGNVLIEADAESIEVKTREFVKLSGAARGRRLGSPVEKTKTVGLLPTKWSD